jgi:mRNA interferase RelE/StbE
MVEVVFTRAAERSLDRLPPQRSRQILIRIEEFAGDPMARRRNVKPLAGSDLIRMRVGDYRVLLSLDPEHQIITVELIRTRGDIYKR